MKKFLFLTFLFSIFLSLTFAVEDSIHIENYGKDKVIVKYKKYGEFSGIGTENYQYTIKKMDKLIKAVGEGIYPNQTSIFKNPVYQAIKNMPEFQGNHWDFVTTRDFELNYLKWATAKEKKDVKLFYTALALENAGLIERAIKTYYAILVHFPKSISWTYWKTAWSLGNTALYKIKYLTENNTHLGIKLIDAEIKILNVFDENVENDIFIVNPGQLKKVRPSKVIDAPIDINKFKIIKTIGTGKVKLVQYENKHWQLFVDEKPFKIRGMAYTPNKIGLSPDIGTLNVTKDWMYADYNKNKIIDAPFEAWVDKNRNNIRDADEHQVGDFTLMQEMGINTIRLYHCADLNKEVLKKGYEDYNFMYLMGNFIGMYSVDSGAKWSQGTDYTNETHIKNMLDSVRRMVEEYKDKPYILMWVLGNENNYATNKDLGCNGKTQPEAYFTFVNTAAKLIKSLDPYKRPVAVCNGDILYLDICAKYAPELDVFGANSYRGKMGFNSLWKNVYDEFDRPVLITEFGCSAYGKGFAEEEAEAAQADYHKGNWQDIEANFAGSELGNSLGGVIFEWVDEWWKAGTPPDFDPNVQEKVGKFGAPMLDGWSYEEILGLTTQGDGSNSPFLRQLRPVYFMYKEMWGE